jgi:hypothetical protein
MGINDKNLEALEWALTRYPIWSVLELGAQIFYQNYESVKYGAYADRYYRLKQINIYRCIDLNGENGAISLDLSIPHILPKHNLVTDFGTSEHIAAYTQEEEAAANDVTNDTWKHSTGHAIGLEAFYNCWTTKYNASNLLIVSSNPATGHWPGHGHFYYTMKFYEVLCRLTDMRPVLLKEHYAMMNYTDGKEICCVLDVRGSHWISFDEFKVACEHIHPS